MVVKQLARRVGLRALLATCITWASSSAIASGIPVFDGAANIMAKAMQELTQHMTSNVLADEAIKRHLADGVLRDYLGQQLLQPMLGQLSIHLNPAQSRAVTGVLSHVQRQQGEWGGQHFGEVRTTAREVLSGTREFRQDANDFYGLTATANCPANAAGTLREQCLATRNILASQLREIRNIASELDARNNALHRLLKDHSYSTLAELQQKQYMMSTLQAIISNDNMRLQAALAAYQGMRQLYQEKYQTAVQQRVTGSSSSLLGALAGTVATRAALEVGRRAAGGTNGQLFQRSSRLP